MTELPPIANPASPRDTSRQRTGTPLRAFLTRLIWFCVGPLILLAAYLAIDRVRHVQDDRDLRAADLAKNLAATIDQDLTARIGALHMLAVSPLADSAAHWEALYQEAQGFRQSFSSHVILADLEMQMIFNTRAPFGTALPRLPRPQGHAAAPIALETGKPAVGDTFHGPIAGEPLVAIAVPALRDGKVALLLLTTFETRQFQHYLDQTALPPGWSVALLDGHGDSISRRAPPGLNPAADVDASGRFVARSAVSPWSVVLEIPRDVYRAPLVDAATALVIAILGTTLAGVLGGTLASRRLARSVASLARTPAAGAPPPDITEIATVRDLLDEAAARREAAEAALRESEAELRFTLEAAQIGDWSLDLASGVASRSLRHDRCFGYDELQPEWGVDAFFRHVHPDDRDEVARTFQLAVRGSKDWRMDCRVVWPDASVHWISAHGSIQQGKPKRMLGIVTDITQRRLAEEARLKTERLEAENRQIQEASRLKSQFLANMSHELRTPLNAIIGFADLLHAGAVPTESPRHQEFLGHIGTSGRHLLQLINDVLDLSKVESGKFEFFPEAVELAPLVEEVEDILHPSIQGKRISVATEIDPALTGLVLDPARLRQVLYNYLSNAIKFTPEGGHVTLRARAEGPTRFRIEVEDDGIGIAAADLPRLFVEFQQLDAGNTRQHQGTGLGLALTRRLVQAQGGSVGVRSTPGVGSVFHLVLARVQGGAEAAASAEPPDGRADRRPT